MPPLPSLLLQTFSSDTFAENWVAVALSAVVVAFAIGMMFMASRVLSSRRRSAVKLTAYECGIPSTGYSWSNINVRFYIFAILFLIFDVEGTCGRPYRRSTPMFRFRYHSLCLALNALDP